MGHNDDHADDAPTGPLPIIRPDGPDFPPEGRGASRAEEGPQPGMMPPPPPGPVPSVARQRLPPPADAERSEPAPPVVEVTEEALRRQDVMAAAVLGAFAVLLLGALVAFLWR
ncbi:hypothetical protein GCM10009678_50030 [Actinomadura kijaniata]|uniref:Uncharacterized protein n=1 Tax=Actinomadura namibiensis TaxID=182080 RepID=A0A7W3QM05_ACTNM|nr:hypothetical protein [Actinomadura namibiensis]MBA8951523.1 hypothetical protein [Actinomadura namibiensis]